MFERKFTGKETVLPKTAVCSFAEHCVVPKGMVKICLTLVGFERKSLVTTFLRKSIK